MGRFLLWRTGSRGQNGSGDPAVPRQVEVSDRSLSEGSFSEIPDHWLPTEARGTFLEQMVGLEESVKATWEQLQVLRGNAHCAQAGAQKTCNQLAELGETLRSSEEEVLRAASALSFLVPWPPNPASPGVCIGVFAPALPLTHSEDA